MTAQEYAFAVMAFVGSVSAIAVVTARNVVHAALYLVITLASVGGVYLVLGAEFTAWVQIIIYVGAIVILFLFGLMLTKAPIGRELLDNRQRPLAAVVGAGIFVGLVYLVQNAFPLGDAEHVATFQGTTGIVGDAIFHDYILPFEAISFLLLAALIGAIVLARKDASP
ncbi:MAG: NADH-quinone oxidoreductase subunit J [Actinomycetota bacterium]|nr:NADH-quinone oxidoreductase subunit J [Actinomycetota bacterium]